jgi:hypothetical protein
MAKSLVMGGRAASLDLDSREGIENLLKVMQDPPKPAESGRAKPAKRRASSKSGPRKGGPKKRR